MNQYEKEAVDSLRPHLAECAVLLRSKGDFPIGKPEKIGAYGRGVRHTLKGGTGSGEVNSRYFVSFEQALKDAGIAIENQKWLDDYDEVLVKAKAEFIEEIKRRAKKNHTMAVMEGMGAVMSEPEHDLKIDREHEVSIYVLSRICGEGNDRSYEKGDFLLADSEIRDIRYLHEHSKKFMLVLNVGGPVDLSAVSEVENVLILSQLGVETGKALVDIITGEANPSGKLTTTWTNVEGYPELDFGDEDDTNYKEGVYVGYRYFDSARVKPLYPFGYGLSYTDFKLECAGLRVDKDKVEVDAKITNVGIRSGKETPQLYVSCPDGKLDKPYQDLAAFAKSSELKAGEEEIITLRFSLKDLASYNMEKSSYILEKGDYILRLGNSSDNTKIAGVLELDEDAVVKKVKNCLGDPGFKDEVYERILDDDLSEVQRYEVKAADFTKEEVSYDQPYVVDEKINDLLDEELVYLNIGAFPDKAGINSIIGSASMSVAGAAGESSTKAKLPRLRPLVMADGPAGIRISPQYYEDKKGLHSYGPTIPATILDYMPKIMQKLMGGTPKLKKGVELKEQYCTAIPIGTAIAQSFNVDFAKTCGDIVGKEMEIFKIDLWLAPALNIHRSVLCGRNFEYYSEDPLVSGKMAAAITLGVQAHKGKGVTIKHYAANNQERNRYNSNSNVSERAMREIYLKGFGISITEARPHALMTSYNLLNGVHTNEHYGLCTDVLRKEFGYDGIIMTDWEVSAMPTKGKHRSCQPEKVALAGGNLYMPGSKGDYKRVMKALKSGELSRKVLCESADRLYKKVRELDA